MFTKSLSRIAIVSLSIALLFSGTHLLKLAGKDIDSLKNIVFFDVSTAEATYCGHYIGEVYCWESCAPNEHRDICPGVDWDCLRLTVDLYDTGKHRFYGGEGDFIQVPSCTYFTPTCNMC